MNIRYKMRNKKGLSKWLVVLVISLISIIVIFSFTRIMLVGVGNKIISNVACKQANEIASMQHINMKNFHFYLLDIVNKCETKYVNITTDDEKTIKKDIANYMATCWGNFLEGKEIFPPRTENYCSVCYVLNFNSRLKNIEGFTRFLSKNYVPGTRMRYIEYLTNTKASNKVELDNLLKNIDESKDVLDISKPIAVVYFSPTDVKTKAGLGTIIGSYAGAVVGVIGIILGPETLGASVVISSALIGSSAGAFGALGYLAGRRIYSNDYAANVFLIQYGHLKDLNCTMITDVIKKE